MAKSKNKYFVVWVGHNPGIYNSWEACKKQVHGYPEAKYKGFATESEAKTALKSSYWDYVGKHAKVNVPNKELIEKYGMPILKSLSVDAACSGNPGIMEYQGVDTQSGKVIFRQGPYEDGTNNIGEFLAIVHALAHLKQHKLELPVYSDSRTALAWLRNKKVKTQLVENDKNAKLFELLARAEKWLSENSYSNEVLKWHTEAWGEIPADFGRK